MYRPAGEEAMKKKSEFPKFEDRAIEVDGELAWRAESALKIAMIDFKCKGNLFQFKTDEDAARAFRLFNRLKLIMY